MVYAPGQTLTAAALNTLIAPTQGRWKTSAGNLVTGVNTTETLVITTGACALEAASKYIVRARLTGDISVSGGAWDFRIREGNGTGGTGRLEVIKGPLAGVPVDFDVEYTYQTTIAEAAHQWSLTVQRIGGTGNINLYTGGKFTVDKVQTDQIVSF